MENKYLGPHKVSAAIIESYKTPKGNEIVKVIYEAPNLPPETMPKADFERLTKDVPTDFTALREARYKDVIQELKAVLLEHDLKFSDLGYVGKRLVNDVEDAFERASSFLWTGNDKEWISGVSFLSDRTLLQADQILSKINLDGREKPKDNT